MLRNVSIYILDEFIGGVDLVVRLYIFKIILKNYFEDSILLIVIYLISEIENICDEIIFILKGEIVL